jgi:hypothetical protein
MTDTLPAKADQGRQMAPAEYSTLKDQARMVVRSGLAPKAVNTPEKVLVIAMKGRELGVPIMQALSHIHIVDGKPTISSELMAALVQRAGHRLRVLETDSEHCVVQGVRSDDPEYPQKLAWSMDDAHKAGVANKNTWKNYPAAMLRARAISALCRFAFADVLMGASYTPEELGAEVDEEGQVVEGGGSVQEAEVTISEADPEPDLATEEQVAALHVLADNLFDNKDATLTGAEWLQEQLGAPFGNLTRSRAAALVQKYEERLNEENGEAPDGE